MYQSSSQYIVSIRVTVIHFSDSYNVQYAPLGPDQSALCPIVASLPPGMAVWSLSSDSLRPLQPRPVQICSFN